MARQIGSDRAAADAALKNLIETHANVATYQIAEIYALRNDADKTFEWLDRAWTNRDSGIGYLLFDPLVLRYKHDSRFIAFCRKAGLPTPAEVATANTVVPATAGAKAQRPLLIRDRHIRRDPDRP